MMRLAINKTALKVGPYSLYKWMSYLGVNINLKNNMHNEIKLRINNVNKIYFIMNKML